VTIVLAQAPSEFLCKVMLCFEKKNLKLFPSACRNLQFNTSTKCDHSRLKFDYEMHQNAFGSQALPGPAGEITPKLPSWIYMMGRNWKRKQNKRKWQRKGAKRERKG